MERKNKCKKLGFSTILWAVMAILLCVLPCKALDITEEVTVPSNDNPGPYNVVNVKFGGTLNLLNNGVIAYIVVENGGTLNLNGGEASTGINAGPGSVVNITGGVIGGVVSVYGDQTYGDSTVTVYGPKFDIGTIYSPPQDIPINDLLKVMSEDETQVLFSLTIYSSSIEVHLRALTIPVEVDIKPGSYPNSINLGSKGVVPVAILSSEDFVATTVNPDTVALAGAGVAVRGKGNKYLAHEEDINDDGLMDLVCQVETENLDPGQFQDGYAVLTGYLLPEFGGTPIEGSDEITIVP